jgi:hypothetical protein
MIHADKWYAQERARLEAEGYVFVGDECYKPGD